MWRVWEEKLLLAQAIKEQEDNCLAKEVLQEQVRMGWPGLAQEVQKICQQTGLPDATADNVRIDKKTVKEAIKLRHLKFM